MTDDNIKVVDRRWWAKDPGEVREDTRGSGKPTYLEDLEKQLAEKDKQIAEYLAKYRGAAAEFEEARLRLRREISKDTERSRREILADLLPRNIAVQIFRGLLENAGAKAIVSKKPKMDLAIKVTAGRPEGPPPMPGDMLMEPAVAVKRSTAVTGLAASPWAPLVAVAPAATRTVALRSGWPLA